MRVHYEDIFPCEICSVQGKPYLFSDMRVDRKTVHPSLHVYDVRDDCDGEFWQIQSHVMVNFWGTIIGLEELDLEDGQYWCPPDDTDPDLSSEGQFIGQYAESHADYIVWYAALKSLAKAASAGNFKEAEK